MTFNDYYLSELSALRQLGQRFAERNPGLAPWLGQPGQDPDVERLLEGFAFLTGRLRQKLDDDLPELTHSLVQLLWPNYLRPLPAFSILQFEPLEQPEAGRLVVRGSPIESRPVDGVRCGFRTCYDTEVHPLALTELSLSADAQGALLTLRLHVTGEGHLGQLSLQRLRLHLAGERPVSQTLYLSLLRHLQDVVLLPLGGDGQALCDESGHPVTLKLPADSVQPVGFAEHEALVPYPLNTFRGYRILQEYFAFQDKFLFVELQGLDALQSLPQRLLQQGRGFELRLAMGNPALCQLQPGAANVRLYCTPIVNLFRHDALPLRIDGRRDDYLLMACADGAQSRAVYSVDSVVGWRSGGLGYRNYVPFESFEHDPSFEMTGRQPYYSVRQRPSPVHGGLETWLSFTGDSPQVGETLSVELTCTNHDLPRRLQVGEIDQPCENGPAFVRFRNIVPATRSYPPPLGRDFLWRLISNMSLNYLSLTNVEALKVILQTYDLPRHYDPHAERLSNHLIGGLQAVQHLGVDRLHQGLPVRGLRTLLRIDPRHFSGAGDLFLFASVLNEFFALYASLNSFHELQVITTQGENHRWKPRMGQQPLL
ncbi:type VI secretion system baseplate subunit TssF [uncultured Pseudomonas sp.]|uniref:type VI secretion system baseplate subunit TssF n=1 Tax=uncultured Pseudomonas sp. TaxID=114707 RepID=UPI0025F62FC7|nr:type VI secretion system baseplate subunit TssF [uncultured Pseudomonas sp.]